MTKTPGYKPGLCAGRSWPGHSPGLFLFSLALLPIVLWVAEIPQKAAMQTKAGLYVDAREAQGVRSADGWRSAGSPWGWKLEQSVMYIGEN